ncbi:octopamine receptor Oamb-like [Stylophora pistillata]|uniref:octopamine receptor Oamb-like n=1 Tax=Stylophora pistillata TaxID=50429 RepID=UPI000C05212C|nr:octopamine receptor Oamb-like [Stylophora pistillata]
MTINGFISEPSNHLFHLPTDEAKGVTSVLEEIEGIILTVLYAITMLVTFAGNGFLIYIVWKKPEVRSLTSFMFVNMAIADLLVGLVVMPWSIAQVHTDGLWMIPGVFGKVMCKGVVYIAYATLTASILCLTFMTVDRYYAISHTSVLGDPYKAIRGLFLYLVVLNYLIPLSVNSILHTIIARRLWFHVAPGNQHLTGNREQHETSERRVVRTLVIETCAFSFCWLPAQVVHMIFAMQTWNIEPIVMYVCFWSGHANSAINPWLLIYYKQKLRIARCQKVNDIIDMLISDPASGNCFERFSLGQFTCPDKSTLENHMC